MCKESGPLGNQEGPCRAGQGGRLEHPREGKVWCGCLLRAINRNWQTDWREEQLPLLWVWNPRKGWREHIWGPWNRNKITKSSSTSSVCLCVYVSVLRTALFFSKLSAQKHTLALLTLAKYGLTGHSFDKNYTFQWFFFSYFFSEKISLYTHAHMHKPAKSWNDSAF